MFSLYTNIGQKYDVYRIGHFNFLLERSIDTFVCVCLIYLPVSFNRWNDELYPLLEILITSNKWNTGPSHKSSSKIMSLFTGYSFKWLTFWTKLKCSISSFWLVYMRNLTDMIFFTVLKFQNINYWYMSNYYLVFNYLD